MQAVGYHILSNGPTWSLDGKKFYYVCSLRNFIREYDYDAATGAITNGNVCTANRQASG